MPKLEPLKINFPFSGQNNVYQTFKFSCDENSQLGQVINGTVIKAIGLSVYGAVIAIDSRCTEVVCDPGTGSPGSCCNLINQA